MSIANVKTWIHSRKGCIVGIPVGGDEIWLDIQLVEEHRLRYLSEANRGREDKAGEVLRVRRSFLTEAQS